MPMSVCNTFTNPYKHIHTQNTSLKQYNNSDDNIYTLGVAGGSRAGLEELEGDA